MHLSKIKDYCTEDTICAIATGPSASALGVIKLSGRKAFDILSRLFLPKNKKDIKCAKTYSLHYGWIIDKTHSAKRIAHSVTKKTSHVPFGEASHGAVAPGSALLRHTSHAIIDEVLVSIMRKPHSYTKEDVAEISSHGGMLVLNKILELLCSAGARLAHQGEFTYRAVINGRIDLLKAQSILDIVGARSDDGLYIATQQLAGSASDKICAIKNEIKSLFSQTETLINFPEDETSISLSGFRSRIKKLERETSRILEIGAKAKILREGLRCVICGKTNAGKSTLFNRLLKEERVIVSEIAGTTRDVVEETINIGGVPLRIYDTAGILEPRDLIAKKAVEKTSRAFEEADLVIMLLDGSHRFTKDDYLLLHKLQNGSSGDLKTVILAINKSDLKQKLKMPRAFKAPGPLVRISALKNIGIRKLEKAIFKSVYKKGIESQNCIFLNQFQENILNKVKNILGESVKFLEEKQPVDFINLSLRQALDELGKLSGEIYCEEIFESIFSNFCIGK